MRTNSKQVIEAMKSHVLEHFTQDELKIQVKAMQYNNQSDYQIGEELVMGGSFLIYYTDVKKFLNGLGINPENKEYTDQQSWDLYKHMVAKAVERLVK